jgi:hypothetical protein
MADIEQNRACTDMPCILAFAFFLIFLVSYIWGPAYAEGDPDRLIRGVDFKGQICGKDSAVKDLQYAYWPDLTAPRFKVCTDNCTVTQGSPYLTPFTTVVAPYESELLYDKYCIPKGSDQLKELGFNADSERLTRQIGDLNTALPVIGASIAIAFAVSFVYIGLMKLCVGILVWGTITAIIGLGAYIGLVYWQAANDADADPDDAKVDKAIAGIAWGATFIFFVIIVFGRNRIRIAVEVIKSASRALGDMPLMVLFPIWPLLVTIGFFFAWLYGCLFIFSAGPEDDTSEIPTDISDNNMQFYGSEPNKFIVIDYDNVIRNAFAPHFFLFLWVIQILVYTTFMTISGAVADWYFTRRDDSGNKIRGPGVGELSNSPVIKSLGRALRYHLGTIFFAAGLIALVQFARYAIRYMERMANGGKKPNKLQKLLFKLVDCLLWCLECCLDKISKNAMIFTAIYGDAFCPAVCGSFALVWANLMRVAAISFFSTIVTALGKILIPLITVGLCGSVLFYAEPFKSDIDSIVWPLLVIFVLSVAVGLLFLTVYDTAIDTVFMCFLIDEKVNKQQGMMLADEGLRNIVQKYEAESKKLADDMQAGRSSNQVENENNSI